MTNFGAIVLCRMDSNRLQGKVLTNIQGQPLIWYVLSRCQQVEALRNNVIVATSNRPVDNPIADYCAKNNLNIFRGDADDVAGRVLNCAQAYNLEYFFRVNADSPFFEPRLIEQAWQIASTTPDLDFITNVRPRSFPYGVSVELFKTSSFHAGYNKMTAPDHFEHVTKFFYDNLSDFHYHNIPCPHGDLSAVRLTVDTSDDLERFRIIINLVFNRWSQLEYIDAVQLYKEALDVSD